MQVLRDKDRLNRIIAKCTGRPAEKVCEDTERDHYMTAEEALKYGIVDEILDEGKPKPKKKK